MSGRGGRHLQQRQSMGVYQAKERIHDIFLHKGHKDLLMLHIHQKCIQYGWSTKMREKFLEYVRNRGPENVNVSHMIIDLARLGRDLFPPDLRKILLESIIEVAQQYFTIDDTVAAVTEPENPHSDPEKTFLFQSRDIKPDPGIGVDVGKAPDSPPPGMDDHVEPFPPMETRVKTRASATATTVKPGVPPHAGAGRSSPVKTSPTKTSPAKTSPTKTSPAKTTSSILAGLRGLSGRRVPLRWSLTPPVLRPETGPHSRSGRKVAEEVEESDDDDDDDDDDDKPEEEEEELMDV